MLEAYRHQLHIDDCCPYKPWRPREAPGTNVQIKGGVIQRDIGGQVSVKAYDMESD